MERLTNKDKYGNINYAKLPITSPEQHVRCEAEVLERLYEYEEKLGTDLPPCKIGDKIYVTHKCCFNCPEDIGVCTCEHWQNRRYRLYEETVNAIVFNYDINGNLSYYLLTGNSHCHKRDLKKDWFLTKEEAELALLEKQGIVLYEGEGGEE